MELVLASCECHYYPNADPNLRSILLTKCNRCLHSALFCYFLLFALLLLDFETNFDKWGIDPETRKFLPKNRIRSWKKETNRISTGLIKRQMSSCSIHVIIWEQVGNWLFSGLVGLEKMAN